MFNTGFIVGFRKSQVLNLSIVGCRAVWRLRVWFFLKNCLNILLKNVQRNLNGTDREVNTYLSTPWCLWSLYSQRELFWSINYGIEWFEHLTRSPFVALSDLNSSQEPTFMALSDLISWQDPTFVALSDLFSSQDPTFIASRTSRTEFVDQSRHMFMCFDINNR